MQNKFDWFLEEFENCDEETQVVIFNNFCEQNNNYDDIIYSIDEIDDMLTDYKPSQIIDLVSDNKINSNDSYFVFTIYDIETLNDPNEKIKYYLEDIFKYSDIWKKYFDIYDYKDKVFEEYIDLKPTNMDNDDFCEIVSDAVETNDDIDKIVDYIKNEIEKETK